MGKVLTMRRFFMSGLVLMIMLLLGIGTTGAQSTTWQITYYDDSDLATAPFGSQVISNLAID